MTLAIGFGCSSGATADDIVELIEASVDAMPPDTLIATLDRRGDMGELVSQILGLGLRLFPAKALAQVAGTTTQSPAALARIGTDSVAEAAALAALGPAARLLVPRRTGRLCTCAVAVLPERSS